MDGWMLVHYYYSALCIYVSIYVYLMGNTYQR